jgi:beta-phosphoglucomutase-like phosphatase (HAD superfamily)
MLCSLKDNDGTLVHSMPIHHDAWQKALAPHNILFTSTRFYAMAGMPAGAIVNVLAEEQNILPPSVEHIASVKEDILAITLKATKPVKPSLDVLIEAKKRGMRVALASGGSRKDVLASLIGAGILKNDSVSAIDDIFHAVITAENVRRGKPDPETFTLAALKLGVDASRCVGLEDGDLGLEALQSAGMRAVDVRHHPDYPLADELRAVMEMKTIDHR